MKNDFHLKHLFQDSRILRPPRHALATFGPTTLRYILLSTIADPPGCCRMRRGEVIAQRPQILTPDLWKKRFEGFGDDAAAYQKQLEEMYGDSLRALEYTFRNDLHASTIEHEPLPAIADRTAKIMEEENAPRTALLEGPDGRWPLSIMKFVVEMTLKSFPSNVRELDERGMFNPEERRDRRLRLDIERLFQAAERERSAIERLGALLQQSGLFAEYEDRFFALLRR